MFPHLISTMDLFSAFDSNISIWNLFPQYWIQNPLDLVLLITELRVCMYICTFLCDVNCFYGDDVGFQELTNPEVGICFLSNQLTIPKLEEMSFEE